MRMGKTSARIQCQVRGKSLEGEPRSVRRRIVRQSFPLPSFEMNKSIKLNAFQICNSNTQRYWLRWVSEYSASVASGLLVSFFKLRFIPDRISFYFPDLSQNQCMALRAEFGYWCIWPSSGIQFLQCFLHGVICPGPMIGIRSHKYSASSI